MARASWTYEVPPVGAPSVALEEYMAETPTGERLGRVVTVLRHGDDFYLAVDRGTLPGRDVRAVPWSEVEGIDHDALAVRLPREALARGLELDPDKGVESGDAEARRVTDLPPGTPRTVSPDEPGPVDRPSYLVALGFGLLGMLALLGLFVAASRTTFTWEFVLFAIPLVLFVLAGVSAYRLFRRPYERADR